MDRQKAEKERKSSYGATGVVKAVSNFGSTKKTGSKLTPTNYEPKGGYSHSVQLLIQRGYTVLEKVGVGNYAAVYRIKSVNNKEMAVKIIELERVSKNYKVRFLPRELEIIAKLRHENIVKVYAIQTTHKYCYIFMEYAPNGTLGDFIRRNGAIPEWMARPLMLQITQALNYLHSLGIAHRDIKLENILLDKSQNPKLTDFSYSLVCVKDPITGNASISKTFCGSLPYMPPEILEKQPYDPKASDVWALGVCLYIILNDKIPFKFNDIVAMVKSQLNREWKFKNHIKENTSEECRDLISKMLDPNHNTRITTGQMLEHPWLTKELCRDFSTQISLPQKSEPSSSSKEASNKEPDDPEDSYRNQTSCEYAIEDGGLHLW